MTKEEKAKAIADFKSKQRDYALKNLEANLVDVGTSYFVYKNKSYGNETNAEIRNYKYFPAFKSGLKAYDENGEEYDIMQKLLLESGEEDELYSGDISEKKIMKECAQIINESASRIKISDLVKLMGSEMDIKKEFQDKYVGDIIPNKIKKEDYEKLSEGQKKARKAQEELYKTLIASYQGYLVKTKVGEASLESAKEIPKGLEAILAEPKKESKEMKLEPKKYGMAA